MLFISFSMASMNWSCYWWCSRTEPSIELPLTLNVSAGWNWLLCWFSVLTIA